MLAACFSLSALESAAASSIYYAQDFPNATAGNIALNSPAIDWRGYSGNFANDNSSNTASGSGFTVSNGTGSDGGAGYVFKNGGSGKGITYTSDFTPLNRSSMEIESFTFALNNNNSTDSFYVAIQLDVSGTPTWFVNATAFTVSTPLTWETKTLTFSTSASEWYNLTLDPGVSLSVGSMLSSDLPSGNLIGAGIYTTNGLITAGGPTQNIRFDSFEIAVVPEPASLSLAGACVLGIASCRILRRRKRD